MANRGVDVEQVMEEVNRAVAAPDTLLADFWKEAPANAPNLAFIYPPFSRTLAMNLDLVSRNWEVDGEFELASRMKLVAGPAVAFKRLVRAALRWYVNPILHQVRKFNMLVTRTLHDLSNNLEALGDRVADLEDAPADGRLEAIERRLEAIERRLDGLDERREARP